MSVPLSAECLLELAPLDTFQRLRLSSVLLVIAALKGTKNFRAVKYNYALIRQQSIKVFAMTNHYLDIIMLASAITMNAYDLAIKEYSNETK